MQLYIRFFIFRSLSRCFFQSEYSMPQMCPEWTAKAAPVTFTLMMHLVLLHNCGKPTWKSDFLTLAWPSPSHCGHLRNESEDVRSLSFHDSLTYCFAVQINRFISYTCMSSFDIRNPFLYNSMWYSLYEFSLTMVW